ncbi:BTAD domain-containing putative transcriptional regulator [Kitasatospora sp. NPDC056531]|uniref:AfsR/SARP family transcriptional regulator n=1 Tax=Kitasatospora sp. NPDC056531 TaxID=3345856 RepID=UPI0036CFC397
MQFRILGPAEIFDEARQRRVQLNSPKQRMLLGALLARLGTPVPTDLLIRELWGGDAPDKVGNALQAHVSRLRQVLIEAEPARANAPRLVARGTGYLLQARPDEIDSSHFRMEVIRARRLVASDPRTAYSLLCKALKLWRGPALDGGAGGPLCAGAAAQLEEERLRALEDRYDAALRLGLQWQVVGQLEELVTTHPGRERFHEQLAVALKRCGREVEEPAGAGRERGRPSGERGLAPVSLLSARSRQLAPDADRSGQRGQPRQPGDALPATGAAATAVTGARTGAQTGRSAAARSGGDHPATLEILQLRLQIEQLICEQESLRAAVEHLTALVAQREPGHHLAAVRDDLPYELPYQGRSGTSSAGTG